MVAATNAPYGAWKSPITPEIILGSSIRFGQLMIDGADIYWSEGRPAEGGRNVILRQAADGTITELTPPDFNVRTLVHDYGGGAFLVHAGTLYFTNFTDQRIYRQVGTATPEAITPDNGLRYADFVLDSQRNRLITVCEDHSPKGREAINTLVAVPIDGIGQAITLVTGNDFYSTPRISPDGTQLAWLTWNHPNMPWDSVQLWTATFHTDGTLGNMVQVAGQTPESIFQPEWSPDGTLYFVSDRSEWWNLYHWHNGQVDSVHQMAAEFAAPQWSFRMNTYAFVDAQTIFCTYTQDGQWNLGRIDLAQTTVFTRLKSPFSYIYASIAVTPTSAYFVAGSPSLPLAFVKYDMATQQYTILKAASSVTVDPAYISIPEALTFTTMDGASAYAFYYPPTNPDFVAPAGELPPLLVESHGGPTSATTNTLNLGTQYWTSRGFAVLDVNYGGSTGYGKSYRQRLHHNWGIVDVDDCVNGAMHLVRQQRVDGDRLAITGGSAGGYTTLCALTFTDTFKAGASLFGISDLEALAQDSHKFESHDMENLIGPYPLEKHLYIQRSPIHHTDQLSCPIIFFQGLEDKVVPPNQTEMMVDALLDKRLPVAYLAFEGEQHGFRKAENIRRSLEGQFYFFARVFGFTPADDIEPVLIENL